MSEADVFRVAGMTHPSAVPAPVALGSPPGTAGAPALPHGAGAGAGAATSGPPGDRDGVRWIRYYELGPGVGLAVADHADPVALRAALDVVARYRGVSVRS